MDGIALLFDESDIFTRPVMLPTDAQANILYVEDFDSPAPLPALETPADTPEILIPTYSLEEYTEACQAAHEAGLQTGLSQARHEHTTLQGELRNAALSNIADAIAMNGAERAAAARSMAEDLAGALLAMLLAALPATSAKLAGTEITALLAIVLPPLHREPSLQIQAHPDLVPEITADLTNFTEHFTGTITLTANESLAPADVLVRWGEGEMRRDTRALWAELSHLLAVFALPQLPPHSKGAVDGQ